jgi:hypothetical protein
MVAEHAVGACPNGFSALDRRERSTTGLSAFKKDVARHPKNAWPSFRDGASFLRDHFACARKPCDAMDKWAG